MVAYGILAVVISRSRLPRPLRITLIGTLVLVVFLIGLSRVWLGVHYPTDVLAGWAAGAVIVLLYRWFTRAVSREPAEVAMDAEPPPG
jgi:undecaprenyl-diphosphatase